MTDYAYTCQKCGESKRGIVFGTKICTKCKWEETHEEPYPY